MIRYTIWGGGGPRGLGDLGQVGEWGGIENHFVNIFTNFTNVQVTMWDGESRSNAWEEPCSHISGGEGRC